MGIFRHVEQAVIAVLGRATRLIDALATCDRARPLGELADVAGLPMSTTHRLMRDLVVLGWADQPGTRGDYRLGPRVRSLGLFQRYRARFFAVAHHVIVELAQRLQAPVSVACLRGHQRCLLHEWLPSGGERHPLLEEGDMLWTTAGGRLLFACLPAAARRRLIAKIGPPTAQEWPGIVGLEDLRQELAWIRQRRLSVYRPRRSPAVSAAVLVPDGDGGRLALGFWIAQGKVDSERIALLQAAGQQLRTVLK